MTVRPSGCCARCWAATSHGTVRAAQGRLRPPDRRLAPGAAPALGQDLLFGPAAGDLLDPGPVRRAWDDHQAGRANNAYELWDVVMFSVWAEERGIGSA